MGINRRFRMDLWKIAVIIAIALFVTGFSIIFGAIRHKLRIETVFNQVTECVGNSEITMFGEYQGQTVKIAHENRDVIWNAVTDKNIEFSSANKQPVTEPIKILFDDKLELDIYQTEGIDVFVKQTAGKQVKYYIINGTCSFTQLEKMVSLEGWYVPNIKFSHLDGKIAD